MADQLLARFCENDPLKLSDHLVFNSQTNSYGLLFRDGPSEAEVRNN